MRLFHTHLMDVIGSSLEETHEVTIHYEVINDEGKVSVLEGTGLFVTDLKFRLLSPQYHFMDIQRLKNTEVFFTVNWNNYVLKIFGQVPITIHYEQTTHINILCYYHSIYIIVDYLDMTVFVTREKNYNLVQL